MRQQLSRCWLLQLDFRTKTRRTYSTIRVKLEEGSMPVARTDSDEARKERRRQIDHQARPCSVVARNLLERRSEGQLTENQESWCCLRCHVKEVSNRGNADRVHPHREIFLRMPLSRAACSFRKKPHPVSITDASQMYSRPSLYCCACLSSSTILKDLHTRPVRVFSGRLSGKRQTGKHNH